MEQQLIWTVLPTRVTSDHGTLKFSVFVSPRLTPDANEQNLGDFPDFLDWPSTLGQMAFTLVIEGGPTISATVTSSPSSSVWKLLFNSDTYVQPYAYNSYSDRAIHSFPTASVASFLQTNYLSVLSTSGALYPTLQTLGQLFEPITFYGSDGYSSQRSLIAKINSLLQEYHFVPSSSSTTAMDFLQVMLFHQSHNAPNPAPESAQSPYVRVPITVPPLDFHQIVSTLGKFPWLMHQLGLVIDMEAKLPVSLTNLTLIPSPAPVSVTAKGWTRPTNVSAMTQCTIIPSSGIFAATPASGSEIANGMLQLSDTTTFNVFTVDLDSAAMKALNYAGNVARIMDKATFGTPDVISLPSLRSSGITITQNNRAESINAAFQNSDTQNANVNSASTDVVLFADDITRGYAFDVWNSQTSTWNSLHLRAGTYNFVDSAGNVLQTQQVSDEGWMQLAATQAADGSSNDLYVHESIFKWTGWSLSAPRYGMEISNDDTTESYDPGSTLSEANSHLASSGGAQLPGLTTSFTVQPGTLPLLRFGMEYRIRARAVDLAGNSTTPVPTDFTSATGAFTFYRFDPVPGPLVILREEINPAQPAAGAFASPGESLRTLIIRSNYQENAATYNQALSTSTGANYSPFTERIIAPPRSSQQRAELHGMFDQVTSSVITGMEGDPTTYQDIATRDSWNFQQYTDSAGLNYPIYPSDNQQVNYIPDPLSRGALVTFLDRDLLPIPGLPPRTISFYPNGATWPNAATFKIRLVASQHLGAFATDFSETFDGQVLEISVPQAEVVYVTISSYLNVGDLNVLGVWNWFAQTSPPPANLTQLQDYAQGGNFWMITPFSQLILVHAAQQPLIIPDMTNSVIPAQAIAPVRDIGWTYVELVGSIPIDGTSTVKVDLLATWQEPVDPLQAPSWSYLNGTAHPFELQVGEDELFVVFGPVQQAGLAAVGPAQRHEFGDTKYRHVIYTTVATTRFMESFPSSLTSNAANVTQTSAAYPLDILSSARPSAPQVLYVVPAFQWTRTNITSNVMDSSAQSSTSVRGGGWLRVYMDRPWYSSGDGELLGALLWEYQSAPPDNMLPYVSMVGNDPLWIGGFTRQFLAASQFTLAVATDTNLTLEEEGYDNVSVAGHSVAYDENRQLWYCDIQIDQGSAYTPFVRLALARYQPNSLSGVELSRVVLADFAQLTPDRSVSIVFDPSDSATLNVSLSGVFPQPAVLVHNIPISSSSSPPSELPQAPNSIVVTVEEQMAGTQDPYLGWSPSTNAASTATLSKTGASPETWSGSVTLPAARGSQPMRLVIKEYENYPAEGGIGQRLAFMEAVQL